MGAASQRSRPAGDDLVRVPDGKVVLVQTCMGASRDFECLDSGTPDLITREAVEGGEILEASQVAFAYRGPEGAVKRFTVRNNAGRAEVYDDQDKLVS